ncbi:hypothetical protein ACWDF5_45910, partial [Streptomyces sp. NPDC001076]
MQQVLQRVCEPDQACCGPDAARVCPFAGRSARLGPARLPGKGWERAARMPEHGGGRLVVVLHGGAWRAPYDRGHITPFADFLARRGF